MSDLRKAVEFTKPKAIVPVDLETTSLLVNALRQALAEFANSTTDVVESKALAQPEQEPVGWLNANEGVDAYAFTWRKKETHDIPLYTAPVDAVNMTQERVDETAKREHEPTAAMFEEKLPDQNPPPWVRDYKPKRSWVGYTNEDRERIVPVLVQSLLNHDDKTMSVLLKAILIDIEQQLKERNGG